MQLQETLWEADFWLATHIFKHPTTKNHVVKSELNDTSNQNKIMNCGVFSQENKTASTSLVKIHNTKIDRKINTISL